MEQLVVPGDKIFKDAVHGYIYVKRKYIKSFIDTPNFQRLKRLEQTNMRPLYPCAHHDRFIHSLGTYHLGRMAYGHIKKNHENMTEKDKSAIKDIISIEEPFEIACLLHDVGHAPFSHTFENDFDFKKPLLDDILKGYENIIVHNTLAGACREFISDYSSPDFIKPKPHEKIGAILVLTEYFNEIESYGVDPYLVARMIIGLKYKSERKTQISNCFIELLNGTNIDVDKLDYIVRDQWATGRNARHIDYERLLSSMYILKNENDEFTICFHKKAITEVISVLEAKRMIVSKILTHHQLLYDTYVLKEAIREVTKMLDPDKKCEDPTGKIFSLNAIMKDSDSALGPYHFRLLTDDDLIHILKTHLPASEYAKEWFNRDYRLKAVWKTVADYNYFFKSMSSEERKYLYTNRDVIIPKCLTRVGIPSDYHCEAKVADEYAEFEAPQDIKIFIKDQIEELGVLMNKTNSNLFISLPDDNPEEINLVRSFFLLYVDKDMTPVQRDNLVEQIVRITRQEYRSSQRIKKSQSTVSLTN
jgi:HD superfamily phosphohydrolase